MDFFKKPNAKKRKRGAFSRTYNNDDSEDEGGSGANGGDYKI